MVTENKNQWDNKSPQALLEKLKEFLDEHHDEIKKCSDLKVLHGTLYVYLQRHTEWSPAECFKKVGYGHLVKHERGLSFEEIKERLHHLKPDFELLEVSQPGQGRRKIRFLCLNNDCGFISDWTTWTDIQDRNYGCKRCSQREPITNEMHDERLKSYFGDKIIRLDPIVNAKKKVKHKCVIHDEEFSVLPYSIAPPIGSNSTAKNGCPQCKPNNPLDNTIHDQRLISNFGDKIVRIDNVIDSKTPILHKCNECDHLFKAAPQNIAPRGNRRAKGCPQCAGRGQLSDENHDKRLRFWHESNIVRLEPTVDAKYPILHKCNVCRHEWRVTPNKVAPPNTAEYATGCPNCNNNRSAMGLAVEKIVYNILQELKLKVTKGLSDSLKKKWRQINETKRIYPDFSIGSRIIDCKLSLGAIFKKDDNNQTTQNRYCSLGKVRFIVIEPWKGMTKRIIKRGRNIICHVSALLNRIKDNKVREKYLKELIVVLELDHRNPNVIIELRRTVKT